MLVFTRRAGEKIIINGNIEVTFLKTVNDRGDISIGISAPRDVTVDREEIHERKKRGEVRSPAPHGAR